MHTGQLAARTINRHSLPFISLLLFFTIPLFHTDSALGQEYYAIDAGAGCWGEVGADPSLNPGEAWTGECWVYLADESSGEQVLFRSASQPDAWTLKVVEGVATAVVTQEGMGEIVATGSTPLALGAWSHVLVQLTGTELILYVNGILDGTAPANPGPLQAPGPILISSGEAGLQFQGLIDQIQLSDTVRADGNFDPFSTDLLDLRVGDHEISGWELGTGPGDLQEAWDYPSLYLIINGGAELYIDYNFQYAVQQLYYGQISGLDHTVTLWMTDQGTPEDAQGLYNDPLFAPPFTTPIDTIGEEARIDDGLLFDWSLEFWRDRYYVSIIISKETYPAEALQIAAAFAETVDENILARHLFALDEHSTALWHLDEGAGTQFYDATGHGNEGTLTDPAWASATPYEKVVYITAARILEGEILSPEIDSDDTAFVAFSERLLAFDLNAGNIDDVLELSGGHSWLSGSNELGEVIWDQGRDTLLIGFSVTGGAPSIADGDTVTPNPQTVMTPDSLGAGGYRFIRFETVTGLIEQESVSLPVNPYFHSVYPSPFNARAVIRIDLPAAGEVDLCVYNLLGQQVSVIHKGKLAAGEHHFNWDATGLVSGIYLVSFQSGADPQIRKAVLLK